MAEPSLCEYLKYIEHEILFAHVARVGYMRFFMSNLSSVLPNVPLIYDTVDLHFLREEREELLRGISPRRKELELKARREEELSFIDLADAALVVSQVEKDLLTKLGYGDNVALLSNMHSPITAKKSVHQRTEILFVGNFHHRPNLDAIKWFLSDVYPLIQQKAGDVPVTIIGAPLPAELESSSQPEVTLVGWADELEMYYSRARLAIAPLRFGAGVKGKIGEAWSHGVPVVMTDIGAEGMHVLHEENALIANTASDFAEATLQLLTDDELWEKLSIRSSLHVEAHFGMTSFANGLNGILSKLSVLPEEFPHQVDPTQLKVAEIAN